MIVVKPQRALRLRPLTWAAVGSGSGFLLGLSLASMGASEGEGTALVVMPLFGGAAGCAMGVVVGAVRYARSRRLRRARTSHEP